MELSIKSRNIVLTQNFVIPTRIIYSLRREGRNYENVFRRWSRTGPAIMVDSHGGSVPCIFDGRQYYRPDGHDEKVNGIRLGYRGPLA